MSTQPGRSTGPAINVRGAVDLGAVAARVKAAGSGQAAGAAGGSAALSGAGSRPAAQSGGPAAGDDVVSAPVGPYVLEVTDANFVTDAVELSKSVPVLLDFWATWCEPCKQLSPVLEKLTTELRGRVVLGTVDVDANPQLAQAFQVQSIPSVFALVKGQPVPLFQGAQPEAQIKAVVAELLRVAEANGVTGAVAPLNEDPSADGEGADGAEPYEEPLPPRHQEAYDAIERDDLEGAVTAYQKALRENPGDDLARIGLAQVNLLLRTRDADLAEARAAAADAPADVDAQILVADLDLLGGHVKDAFTRLIDTVRITAGDDRDRVRQHLVELFDVVGPEEPLVPKARLALANALF